jgi:putative NIF3 family GTP cyclohydrolase 1 type 2
MTIRSFIHQVKTSLGIEWRETAIDTLLYGNPDIELKNIAVVMMATQEVIEEAVKKGCNLIITHEPLFYNHHHKFESILNDAVYRSKERYLRDHNVCVFHLHDNLHHARLDYIAVGMAKKLNWERYCTDDHFKYFRMPDTQLAQILNSIQTHLQPTCIRYIGDKDRVYENVVVSWGFMGIDDGIRLINRHEESVLITGETHEWEFVEYIHDAVHIGFRKALVVIGHIPSEECGVEFFCGYLQKKFPSLSIMCIPTNDLFRK